MTTTTAPKVPSEHFKIQIKEQDYNLFMSFGLMNTLAIPIKSVDDLLDIDHNPDLRNFILHSCLDSRDENGITLKAFPLETLGYSQGEEILAWVRGHLEDFFITRLRNKLATQKKVNQTLTQR